ncbi:MAG: hypothetical protein ABJF10_11680 [Chthoniobacter sp.]|uniref:hypothetical protein n=1 Tax=Chthoniobacter sp. TaxID=2510640 RepID=UPI0032A4A5E2
MHRAHLFGVTTACLLACLPGSASGGTVPPEPVEIGHESQFVHDLYIVDTTWGLKPKGEPVKRVLHQPTKHSANPLITGDDPSHLWVLREDDGRFRMWYQANVKNGEESKLKGNYSVTVAYAESADGVHWDKPALDLFPDAEQSNLPHNAVIHHVEFPRCDASAPQILEVPEKDRHGFRYVMVYTMSTVPLNGIRIVGSQDGIHWDAASDRRIARLSSDTHNTVHYDTAHDEYVMFCRSKNIYRAPGQTKEMIDSGESRRGMSRMSSKDLWTEWNVRPQTILMPDERDADLGYNYFMAMPVHRHAGVWWGLLAPFQWNDLYASEIAWSRDGWNFERLPARQHLIEFGPEGAWDHSMVVCSPRWVEVGDEWWLYYAGFDGAHGDALARKGAIGLATMRKEGFVSQHGPATGGVVCTRALRWPGGPLLVNADAHSGELRVRVSDELRKPIPSFNYDDMPAFTGNNVAQEVTWKGGSLATLKDRVIRLEFQLKNADLYTFRAAEEK